MSTPEIQHHKTYFIDEPKPRNRRVDFEIVLLTRQRPAGSKNSRSWRKDGKTFRGDTLDEAEQKMVGWIESSGATEADFENEH